MKRLFSTALFRISSLIVGACSTLPAFACTDLLPNLRPLPASDIQLVMGSDGQPLELRFGATNWNSGDGKLELRGTSDIITDPDGTQRQRVVQRVYDDCGGSYDIEAGWFEYHPAHQHFHFDNFARYFLRPAGAQAIEGRAGSKTTFCIMDTTSINSQLRGASGQTYTTCGLSVQGMSVGWGDTYGSQLAGQSISLLDQQGSSITAGTYWLEINVDPSNQNSEGQIRETRDDDNWSCVVIEFFGDPVASYNILARRSGQCSDQAVTPSIASVTPNSVQVGFTTSVEILGTGFDPVMPASFTNGSTIPTLSNLVFVNSTTINATVKVSGKKQLKDPTVDLNLGSPLSYTGRAVKVNALTIVPRR